MIFKQIYLTLTETTSGQSGPTSNDNEGIFLTPERSRTGASTLDAA